MTDRLFGTPNGLLAAARECGLARTSFRQIAGSRSLRLLDNIFLAFTRGGLSHRHSIWMWEDFRDPVYSLHREHSLDTLLLVAPADTPVWFVVQDEGTKRESGYWLFEGTVGAVIAVLMNHPLIEFYVVSRSLDWLVAENHHDLLIGVGDHATTVLRAYDQAASSL